MNRPATIKTASTPAVSVILPTFNRAHLLPQAMTSVLTQSFTDLELIVVDDGSTDNTAEVVANIKDSRVIYCQRKKNGGVSAARNTGLSMARGALVAFQDSDDEWLPEKLRFQFESLCEHGPGVFSVGVVLRHFKNSVRQWPPDSMENELVASGSLQWLLSQDPIGYCQSLLVPRSLMIDVSGFDESLSMWEDWDLLLRLSQKAQISLCPNAKVLSKRQSDSLTSDRSRHAAAIGRVIDKHADLLGQIPRNFAHLQDYVGRSMLKHGFALEAVRRFMRSIALNAGNKQTWIFLLRALRAWLKKPYHFPQRRAAKSNR